ncbi:Proteophosphoglycan ppg4 [Rhodotorula toruloides ATCC 204091]|uniref:Proteophosphoglycan ppg4 n=1 Tax=Rhodotorula toruloides TaxID=5286 RepID=A0A0K3CML9_RHOTO|nr:Proteophosphoglycan ppg4 [Rhodotorula toruloides ATCC 204091]PRQ70359.1 Proteophosphoglycan ppg4 [Rhodotorula toruloides]
MINAFHWLGTFLFLAAMGLLIVASPHLGQWCAPFARSDAVNVLSIVALAIGFLHGTLNGQRFTFGNWGYCIAGRCSKTMLGYDRGMLNSAAGTNLAGNAIVSKLSKTLILTPICAGLAFIALLFSLSTHLVMGILASLWGLLALVATCVALGLELGLFITAKRRINRIPNSHASLASCIWLVVAAAGCLLIGSFLVCLTRHRRSRRDRDVDYSASYPAMRSTAEEPVAAPVASETYSTGARTNTVGSTGPLMNDTTHHHHHTGVADSTDYNNMGSGYNAGNTTGAGYTSGATGTKYNTGAGYDNGANYASEGTQPLGPTTESGVKGHWWQRSRY